MNWMRFLNMTKFKKYREGTNRIDRLVHKIELHKIEFTSFELNIKAIFRLDISYIFLTKCGRMNQLSKSFSL